MTPPTPPPPRKLNGPEESPCEEHRMQIALLKRDTEDLKRDVDSLRGMLASTLSAVNNVTHKVDDLVGAMRPMADWVATQMSEEKKDAESWRETWRGARREFVSFCLKLLFVLVASALGIGWMVGGGA